MKLEIVKSHRMKTFIIDLAFFLISIVAGVIFGVLLSSLLGIPTGRFSMSIVSIICVFSSIAIVSYFRFMLNSENIITRVFLLAVVVLIFCSIIVFYYSGASLVDSFFWNWMITLILLFVLPIFIGSTLAIFHQKLNYSNRL